MGGAGSARGGRRTSLDDVIGPELTVGLDECYFAAFPNAAVRHAPQQISDKQIS